MTILPTDFNSVLELTESLYRHATHILSFEGDSKVVFYEGSYSEYEEWKKAQGGDTQPHRVRYKKLMA